MNEEELEVDGKGEMAGAGNGEDEGAGKAVKKLSTSMPCRPPVTPARKARHAIIAAQKVATRRRSVMLR